LRRLGAVIVDPADIPHAGDFDDAEFEVLLYEFKANLNAYLAEWAPGAGVRTLADVIAFKREGPRPRDDVLPQDTMEKAQKKGPLTDKAYLKALKRCRELSRAKGLDA